MACTTLLNVARKAGPEIAGYRNDGVSLIETVLEASPAILHGLSTPLKIDFYEAVAVMVAAVREPQRQDDYLIRASFELEQQWVEAVASLGSPAYFADFSVANDLSLFLRISACFCSAIGLSYRRYFNRCFGCLGALFEVYSGLVGEALARDGQQALNFSSVKKYRGVRKDVLLLVQSLVEAHRDDQGAFGEYNGMVMQFVTQFVEGAVEVREAEVLDLVSTVLATLKGPAVAALLVVLPSIIQAVLPMITNDFTSYPEVRLSFFSLLKAISSNCLEVLVSLESGVFQTVVNCLLWAVRHEIMSIHEVGIEAINAFLTSVNARPDHCQQFYAVFFTQILNEVLFVATDKMHQNGFAQQAVTLHMLIDVAPRLEFSLFGGAEDNRTQLFRHVLHVMSGGVRQSVGQGARKGTRETLRGGWLQSEGLQGGPEGLLDQSAIVHSGRSGGGSGEAVRG
jgi:exportin-1